MLLNGSDLVGFIKERQVRQMRSLTAVPKLRLLRADDNSVIDVFVRLKQRYGQDIGAEVQEKKVAQKDLLHEVKQLNDDKGTHGIIVQLPVPDMTAVDAILNAIAPAKDVDGLGKDADYDSATATAILWLLAGYNVDLNGKYIVVVGQGRLVGAPLTKILQASGHDVSVCDDRTKDLDMQVKQAEVLISATGQPRLIKNEWIQPNAVVVDAGTASEQGEIIGDVEDAARERDDIKITPRRGGVGPLTIAVLFDHLIRAATLVAQKG